MTGGDGGSEKATTADGTTATTTITTATNGVGAGVGSIRKRAPLPSQQESLAMEQMQGKYRPVR